LIETVTVGFLIEATPGCTQPAFDDSAWSYARRVCSMQPLHEPIPIFRRWRTIAERHTDELAHVNNAVWVRFVVDLAQAHSDALGLDFDTYRRLGGLWVVRRHEIDYHHNAAAGDEIIEATWVSEMRGARCVRHARFLAADGETELVRATTLWAFVDATTLRPKRCPADVAARFVVCEGRP
jgi:acyl-CoA thioester hydrolase